MKIIKVENCRKCPLKERLGVFEKYYCTHQEGDGMDLENFNIVHPNCPLEDVKEEWEEIAEWGSKLAKQHGLTKEDSQKILQHVRATIGRR